ncbi:MAG TPA: outer membrane beta-barrel domain-containing protein [Myxococcales bacterium]|nr:outer membrane beta-barrel domain-containing protein [Myxococcales bacterium]
MRSLFRPEALALALLLSFAARAQDVVYGPDGAPTVVQHKLYPVSGRWEVGLAFDIAVNTALVDQLGGVLGISYHPNEWLDLGVEGLFNHTAPSNLTLNVRNAETQPRSAAEPKDEFANDNQMRAGGFGVVRFAPIYGKFDLASELKVHFQAFLLGGAGVIAVHRESVNLCAQSTTAAPTVASCTSFEQSDATHGSGLIGGGFRFYFNQRFSLRAELRGYFFSSSYKAANNLTQPDSGTPTSYIAAIATFNAGCSLLF